MSAPDLARLLEPFPASDVEWRVGRAGKKGGKVWATCLAYLTNRAIMDRLDSVAGPANWQNDFRQGPTGGILCGIGILIDGQWVWKWDGADNTDIEAVKGGISSSMKRTAVQWGIGRYLYRLDEGFADVHDNGANYGRLPQKDGGDSFRWDPPALPAWALPEGNVSQPARPTPPPPSSQPDAEPSQTFEGEAPPCPACDGPMWDNRTDEKSAVNGGRRPDLKCKDKECDTAIWLGSVRDDLKIAMEQALQADLLTAAERQRAASVAENYKQDPAALFNALDYIRGKMAGAPV